MQWEIGLDSQQIKLVKKLKNSVMKAKDKMVTQVKKLLKVRSEFFSIAKEVEYDFDMLASILTPVQRAKFILFVDSVRNHHDLSVYELWDIKKSG